MKHKIIMDTNVAAKAATPQAECKPEEWDMQEQCIEFIREFTKDVCSQLVLDLDYEIIKEYRNRIPANTEMGNIFWKWFNKYIGTIPFENMVKLEKDAEGNYIMFPLEERTKEFDRSDRKFVALSRTHIDHPQIVEAADGKWLGFKEVFAEYGVHIEFLDNNYAEMMYDRKVTNKRRT